MELIERIRAVLDEDERSIRAYLAHRQHPEECDNATDYDSCSIHIATAAACRYRDQDFGLRQVAAMRKILDDILPGIRADEMRIIGEWGTPGDVPDELDPSNELVLALAEAYGIEPEPGSGAQMPHAPARIGAQRRKGQQ